MIVPLIDIPDCINKGIAWDSMYLALEKINKENNKGIKAKDLIKIMDMTISDIRETIRELDA